MGQLSTTAPLRRRVAAPWPRSTRRRWARPNDIASAAKMFATIPSLPRAELSRLTERMIDRMDEIDGNPDVEFNGDELDGWMGEDDFAPQNADFLGYPGDADDAEDSHDQEQEEAHA